jgi:hypothetical protein
MTSPSVAGLWAAVGGGLGITVRAKTGVPTQLSFDTPAMPALGMVGVTLHRSTSARSATARRFAEIAGGLTTSHYKLSDR